MSAAPMHFVPSADFKARARAALDDPKLRSSFRGAMDFLQNKRAIQFPDGDELQALRDLGEAVRQHALAHLPQLLEQLEAKLTEAGVQVHWAQTPDEANAIIAGIAERHGARSVIKGKSMASEEIALNHYLAERGIRSLESDMGEYIVQLAGEGPSHIVMPAIHKTRGDIAALFEQHIPDTPYTEDVDTLIQTGRRALRHAFVEADIGLSGVNFAAADTGTLWLVENEGNGRLSTTVPPVHIAIMGIEKVVASLDHIVPLATLLTRSATGQAITTYFNLITGPRRVGELDGPREMHVVLLDNGRTQAYADAQLRATLQCIRCGACMNHCPVYTRIGGHAYGTTYPGPIGKIISPHLLGLDATADLPTASSLCGACGEVCPVRIPIPQLLIRLRTEANRNPDEAVQHPLRGQGARYSRGEQLIWRFWRGAFAHPRLYRLFRWAATRLRAFTPSRQMGWTDHREPLRPAARSLADLLRERGQPE
ncbi:iron-sulfur cluster binding protein [Cupriavidus gilardii CR3]|uniref:Iron-sulfur cluster-binding protein n=1 Tax=Cupriavidus gilardii TaxID=82541 RepID=A0A6N1BF33_9BURK|nr:LutB/LldF family L-lactate oxidation iron-sulfur protein [Cupriavidus gilardii]ALD92262.1 iron-sulfur cluster binding protein [Cupriavidus gilardii CR3]KAB0595757.1 iron-sulfur cluster-binding protein [Cupriavidus gilardii]MCT9014801.1 LutB/LldF family L-lactate oxidation iron-sulfur protein [Cupriavidus gilardii]MCT9053213.1 LutB/LldF family L-lactate oxidation iron-sulfur protein [Cupriavidus gilardii]MCT9069990.1 LutB/LldF family L-lactate oxidation iron-sulfur protein [Cupriavidus gilar